MAPKPPPPTIHLADSDWTKRHSAISFRRLMHLNPRPTLKDVFTSTSAAYPPTFTERTYGGHVFAQAAFAAAHTVPYGLHVNSITGYFLLLGDTRYAFEYRVRRTRDGGIYMLRQVEAYQNSEAAAFGKSPVFTCLVSFKRDERNKHRPGAKGQRRDYSHQELPPDYLEKEFGQVLSKKQRFEDWPVCQGMDGQWVKGTMTIPEWLQRGDAYPGLEMRKVDMRGYNMPAVEGGVADAGEAARRWKLLTLYRLIDDQDEEEEAQNVEKEKRKKTGADDVLNFHACAHLYASDRNSLFLCQRALGFERTRAFAGSLSHTVNFHTHADELLMVDKDGRKKVYAQESWTSNSGADRVSHNSRIWDMDNGRILITTVQDGMLRVPEESGVEMIDGDAILRREAKL